jgi:hypothetical protein
VGEDGQRLALAMLVFPSSQVFLAMGIGPQEQDGGF